MTFPYNVPFGTLSAMPDTTGADSDDDGMDQNLPFENISQGKTTDKGFEKSGLLHIEVAIHCAPRYNKDLAPEPRPIAVMLTHDKPGFIVDTTQMNGRLNFIVGFENKPALRITVPATKIRDYVDAYALEEWDIEQEDIRTKEREAFQQAQNPAKPAKGEKSGRGPRRPSKRKASEEIEGEETAEDSVNNSDVGPRKKQATTHLSIENASESGLEEEDTDLALKHQLLGFGRSTRESSVTKSKSPVPPRVDALKKETSGSHQLPRSSPRHIRSSTPSKEASPAARTSHNRPLRDSVASTSSLQAGAIFEALEKVKASKKSRTEMTPSSFFNKNERPSRKSSPQKKSAKPAPTPAAEEDEEEYEVEAILGEKMKKANNGRMLKYYHVKWVGDWPTSWEPKANIGEELIAEYEAGLRAIRAAKRIENVANGKATENGGGSAEQSDIGNGVVKGNGFHGPKLGREVSFADGISGSDEED